MKNRLLIAISFLFMAASYTTGQPGKVKVEDGWIQGMVENDLVVFGENMKTLKQAEMEGLDKLVYL